MMSKREYVSGLILPASSEADGLIDTGVLNATGEKVMARQKIDQVAFVRSENISNSREVKK